MQVGTVIYGMVIVFAISFVWSWIATHEIKAIASGDPTRAALWCSANSSLNFLITFIIAATLTIVFIFPYVLGCTLATHLAVYRQSKRT